MSFNYAVNEESILMCEGVYDLFNHCSGYSWSYFPTLHAQLSQSIHKSNSEDSSFEQMNFFVEEACRRELLHHARGSSKSKVILNLPDSYLCQELDLAVVQRVAARLQSYSKQLVLSLEPTKKMANSCTKESILNASMLHDKGIEFCLRNYNSENDIHVMMLRCGFVNYFDIDFSNNRALRHYLGDKLTANVGDLILSAVHSVELASVARTFPAIYFKGEHYGRKSFY